MKDSVWHARGNPGVAFLCIRGIQCQPTNATSEAIANLQGVSFTPYNRIAPKIFGLKKTEIYVTEWLYCMKGRVTWPLVSDQTDHTWKNHPVCTYPVPTCSVEALVYLPTHSVCHYTRVRNDHIFWTSILQEQHKSEPSRTFPWRCEDLSSFG